MPEQLRIAPRNLALLEESSHVVLETRQLRVALSISFASLPPRPLLLSLLRWLLLLLLEGIALAFRGVRYDGAVFSRAVRWPLRRGLQSGQQWGQRRG